ncbi:proteolipid protein 2-like isoform X2 [Kryptolebias marmoratus]|uniref:proteolipid protein 2-like isoform X2 n=1 Tax=Kryptolebias marmoratus TaxID=37003 RepID=UPI000D5310EB|nr:proteolipid protein 2-like isoform X2 [Kryptolebias marmoratus]
MDETLDDNCLGNLKSFVKTRKGVFLATEVILSFVTLTCFAASMNKSCSAVPFGGMIVSMIFFGMFLMKWDKKIHCDCVRVDIGCAFLYFIMSIVCFVKAAENGVRFASGVLGMTVAILFCYDVSTNCGCRTKDQSQTCRQRGAAFSYQSM